MQLTLSTDYALRILLDLVGHDTGVSSADISRHIGIEREFTLKILRQLKLGGIVRASRGYTGGYMLSRPPERIVLLDVLSVTEETMFISRCAAPDRGCTLEGFESKCQFHEFFKNCQKKLEDYFGSITLQDILDGSYEVSR